MKPSPDHQAPQSAPQAEQAARHLSMAPGESGEEGARQRDEFSLLLEVSKLVVSELDLDMVLKLVAEKALDLVQAETVLIPMLDERRERYTYQAAAGANAESILAESFPIQVGMCGWVLKNEQSLLFGDSTPFGMDETTSWERGQPSALLVPLMGRKRIIGGLSALGKRGGGSFSKHDLELMTLFANQVSTAIENAMLFRELDAEISKRKSSEARARSMLRTALDGVWLADDNGCLLEVNQTACTMLGYSHEELVGLGIHRIEVLETPEAIWGRTLRLKQRGSDLFESRHRRKDGTEFPVEVSLTFLRETDQCVVFIRDITERKQMEKELRESEKRFRHISSSMMDIAYSCLRRSGEDMAIDWMIGGTQALLGCSIEEVMAVRCWRNFVMEEDRPLFLEQVMSLSSGQSSDCELRLRKKDGSLVWVQCYARCEVSEEDKDHHRIFGALVDITGRKQAEEENARLQAQLQQAQKMESLGTLSGGIAHDMNNVLGAILGLASANVETQPPGSPAYRAFETIVKAATRGGEMVRSLLAFARQRKAEDRVLDMNAILQEEIHLLERTTLSRVRLEMDLKPDLHPMRGDASALNNAIMNLCVNAVDAMPENGILTLRTRNVDDDWIEVVVEDTGAGMPKDILDRAMEPFYTTKGVGKGTGLGLSMVYSTVKAHAGQIEIHSTSGQGTQVRMRFPACETAIEAVNPNAGDRSETRKLVLRVLLVDDDELIQSSMEAILQTLGHAVTIVPSGEAALAAIKGGLEPDVVILDMNMPGLGGSGTLPRIRVLLPNVPILLSTGRTDQVALDLAGAHLHVTLLPKPFNIKELKKHLAPFGGIRS